MNPVSAWLPSPKAVSPTGSATVLVGAFENATGETVLDGTLQFALERELTNSRFVRVVSPERVQDILKLMRRPSDARLDRPLALDICRRTPDIRALVTGRVAKVGSQYRHSNAFIQVCDRLAAALEGIGQTDEAVQTLADCETQLATWSDWEFVHPRNSVARSHLAALYRQTGQVEKAEAIEDALRGQLKLADLDHPIVRALKQLPSSNYQAAVRN